MDTVQIMKSLNRQKKEKVLMETFSFQERLLQRANHSDFPICEKFKMVRIIHNNIKEHFSMKISKAGHSLNILAQHKANRIYRDMGMFVRDTIDELIGYTKANEVSTIHPNRDEIYEMLSTQRVTLVHAHYKDERTVVIMTNIPNEDIDEMFFARNNINLSEYKRYTIINVPGEVLNIDFLIDLCDVPYLSFNERIYPDYDVSFSDIEKGDVVIRTPYYSYDEVLNFMVNCVQNPELNIIMMTIYRTNSPKSEIVELLRDAATKYHKCVIVYVERNAKGNEKDNEDIIRILNESGVHVFSQYKYKVHAKMFLAMSSNNERMYAHFSTGNYNTKSGDIYTDIQLFTADPSKIIPAAKLFKYQLLNIPFGIITDNLSKVDDRCNNLDTKSSIWFSPKDLKNMMIGLIYQEIGKGTKGKIVIKANSLADPEIISHLYAAADVGVNIRLIIRSICLMNVGYHRNIQIESYCGRYLEHDRIYVFGSRVFIASADLSFRNMHKRIEYLAEITCEEGKEYIKSTLENLYDINNRIVFFKIDNAILMAEWICCGNYVNKDEAYENIRSNYTQRALSMKSYLGTSEILEDQSIFPYSRKRNP